MNTIHEWQERVKELEAQTAHIDLTASDYVPPSSEDEAALDELERARYELHELKQADNDDEYEKVFGIVTVADAEKAAVRIA